MKNIHPDIILDSDLEKFFKKFPNVKVKNAKVYIYDSGEWDPIGNPVYKGKGYGFVCFETQLAAEIVSKLSNAELMLNGQVLEVHFFEPKQEWVKKLTEFKWIEEEM